MSNAPDIGERVRLLEQQVEQLLREQDETARLLGRTTLTTFVASLVVQRVGQEITALEGAASARANLSPMLKALREQAQLLRELLEEAADAG